MYAIYMSLDDKKEILYTGTEFLCEQYMKNMYPDCMYVDSKGNVWALNIERIW